VLLKGNSYPIIFSISIDKEVKSNIKYIFPSVNQ